MRYDISGLKRADADIVITNANVYTANGDMPRAEAVAVRGGWIQFVGSNSSAKEFIGARTRVIDAEGRAVVPGMVDAHQHLLMGARTRVYNINLTSDMGVDDYAVEIEKYVRDNPYQEKYTAVGFVPELYCPDEPKKETLDAICPDKPIVVLSYDGHTTWVNSEALRRAGITANTPNPDKGVIRRDKSGEATGYMIGAAGACTGGIMCPYMPDYSLEQNKVAILRAQERMLTAGVTTVYDAHVEDNDDYAEAYEELAQEGLLKIKVRGSWFIPRELDSEEEICALIDRCIERSKAFHTDKFRVDAFKFLCDMIVEAETAYFNEPYLGREDGWRGVCIWENVDMLARLFAKIDAAGFQIHIHQMGDAAAKHALDAMEKACAINGGRLRMRHTFAHCQFISDCDKIRMARLGISALAAPYWINSTVFTDIDVPCLGMARARLQYPVKSLIDMGINVGAHSDYTVSMPDWSGALYGLVARALSPKMYRSYYSRDKSVKYTTDPNVEPCCGVCCPVPNCLERVDIDTAVKLITYGGAYSMYLEDVTGSIREGKAADIVMLDNDIDCICKLEKCVEPVMTMCDGDILFEK